jgi:hypothetical protein
VFEWLKKIGKRVSAPTLPARDDRSARNTDEVDLLPYAPAARDYLGQLAYIQLSNFEILTNELKYSPNTFYKHELSEAANKSYGKYRAVAKQIASLGIDVTDATDPFVERIETFHSRIRGTDWYETVIKVYLVGGLLDDFYRRLAVALEPNSRAAIEKALDDKTIEKFAVKILVEAMGDNPALASRLALWGRRIMGDTLLELRAAFDNRKLAGKSPEDRFSEDEERQLNLEAYSKLEPLISELIGKHTMRMDVLGLTA